MKMHRNILRSTICWLLLLIISGQCFSQDTLWWSKTRRLAWEDFRAKPDSLEIFEARSFTGIAFSYRFHENGFTFSARTFFNRKKSWRLASIDNKHLRHEQLHFDITEIFTRRLKEQLSLLKPQRSTVQKTVRALLKQVLDDNDRMQQDYDEETNYGTIEPAQLRWEKKVALLLAREG